MKTSQKFTHLAFYCIFNDHYNITILNNSNSVYKIGLQDTATYDLRQNKVWETSNVQHGNGVFCGQQIKQTKNPQLSPNLKEK